MRDNYLVSLEGWNFDNLGHKVHRWSKVGKQNFYVSEVFTHKELTLQLFKSYDRIVGLMDLKKDETPIVIRLGSWSPTTSRQITKYATTRNYPIFSVGVFKNEVIDKLQEGLVC